MKRILVSGLINVESTLKVNQFPITYSPIEYAFFGIKTNVSGVAFNIAKALGVLGDQVELASLTGKDQEGIRVNDEVEKIGVQHSLIYDSLAETPTSIVLFDQEGRRKIYCDLKDIQDQQYPVDKITDQLNKQDMVVLCNINFNRPLLRKAKEYGALIATDVHVLSDIEDSYNKEFMENADLLFLSDENINGNHKEFVNQLKNRYNNRIIVLGQGKQGVLMYDREINTFYKLPSVATGEVINTVGAGDALFSAFIHYYTKGMEPLECLKRAEIFASLKIGYNGAATGFVTEQKVEEFYNKVTIPVEILT